MQKKNKAVYIPPYLKSVTYGCVAQLVEQLTLNQWVWGSNPHAPTNKKACFMQAFLLVVLQVEGSNREAGGIKNVKVMTFFRRQVIIC